MCKLNPSDDSARVNVQASKQITDAIKDDGFLYESDIKDIVNGLIGELRVAGEIVPDLETELPNYSIFSFDTSNYTNDTQIPKHTQQPLIQRLMSLINTVQKGLKRVRDTTLDGMSEPRQTAARLLTSTTEGGT